MTDMPTPTGRELQILKVLWEQGPLSVRAVFQHIELEKDLAYNTVQTLLRIMEDKGLVEHRATGRTFIYSPSHSRDQVTRRFLHKVFDGALDQMVLTLLQTDDTSATELRELERLIEAMTSLIALARCLGRAPRGQWGERMSSDAVAPQALASRGRWPGRRAQRHLRAASHACSTATRPSAASFSLMYFRVCSIAGDPDGRGPIATS